MHKNTTFNDLLLFAFNETELAETVRVVDALDADPLLSGEYADLLETLNGIQNAAVSPSDRVMQNILAYAACNVLK